MEEDDLLEDWGLVKARVKEKGKARERVKAKERARVRVKVTSPDPAAWRAR